MSAFMLSDCHLADVMERDDDFIQPKYLGARREYIQRCSFCGEVCKPLSVTFGVGHDVELTLRRWKDGDCTLDGMLDRLRTEFQRAAMSIVEPLRERLQDGGEPKFELDVNRIQWTPRRGDTDALRDAA